MVLFGMFFLVSCLLGYVLLMLVEKRLPMWERALVAPIIGLAVTTFAVFGVSLLSDRIYTVSGIELFSLACLLLTILLARVFRKNVEQDLSQLTKAVKSVVVKPNLWLLLPMLIILMTLVVGILNYAWGPFDWDVMTLYDFRGRVLSQDRNLLPLYEMSSGEGSRFVYYFSYPLMTSIIHAITYIGGSQFVLLTYAIFYGLFFLTLLSILFRTYQSKYVAVAILMLSLFSSDYLLQAQTAYTNFPFTVAFTLGMIYFFEAVRGKNSPIIAGLLIATSMWIRFVDPFYYVVVLLGILFAVKNKHWSFIWALLPILIIRQVWGGYISAVIAPYSSAIEAFSLTTALEVFRNLSIQQLLAVPQVVIFVLGIFIKTLQYPLLLLLPLLIFVKFERLKRYWVEGLWAVLTVGIVIVGGIFFALSYEDWSAIPGSAERLFTSLPPTIFFVIGFLVEELFGMRKKQGTEMIHNTEIKLIKSTFYHEAKTKKLLTDFITSAQILSFGEQCVLFEQNFARYQNRKECVFVNSGSSANLAMIQALLNLGRLKKGDRVGFSALTWSTNAMPLIELGLEPVPVDVETETLNVSSRTFGQALKKGKLQGMFITNLLGFCDDIEVIQKICKKEKIIFLEDNCESLGTIYRGKKLGNYSLASSFSFYVGHHMSTVEGGAVCTDDKELATMLRIVRAHGWDRNLALNEQTKIRNKFKVNSTFYSRYTFYDLGYNLRPTEIAGFLGNNQLQYLDEIVQRRRDIFMQIAPVLYAQTDKYFPVRHDHIDFLSNFAIPVVCRTQELRDSLVEACAGKIEIRPIVGGDMTQQPFFEKHVKGYRSFIKRSNSKLIHQQGLYFGNNPELTKAEIGTILKIFTSP